MTESRRTAPRAARLSRCASTIARARLLSSWSAATRGPASAATGLPAPPSLVGVRRPAWRRAAVARAWRPARLAASSCSRRGVALTALQPDSGGSPASTSSSSSPAARPAAPRGDRRARRLAGEILRHRALAGRRPGAHRRALFSVVAVVRRHAADPAAARGRDEAEASSRSCASRAPRTRRRPPRPSARVARDLHDVLAHSLSALALQLEGARLLARDRGADPEIVEAIERAHHLAGVGLDRGARGDRRAARRRAARPGAPALAGRRVRRRATLDRHRRCRASCPPTRGWRSTAPPRRRSPTSASTASADRVDLAAGLRAGRRDGSSSRTSAPRVATANGARRRLRPDRHARAGGAARRAARAPARPTAASASSCGCRHDRRRSASCSPTTSASSARASARCSACSTGSSSSAPPPTARRRSRSPPSTTPTSC